MVAEREFGTVFGTVIVDGKAANDGTLMLSNDDNWSAGGAIGSDGTYEIKDVPVGPVKVAIFQMAMMGNAADRPGPLPGLKNPSDFSTSA